MVTGYVVGGLLLLLLMMDVVLEMMEAVRVCRMITRCSKQARKFRVLLSNGCGKLRLP